MYVRVHCCLATCLTCVRTYVRAYVRTYVRRYVRTYVRACVRSFRICFLSTVTYNCGEDGEQGPRRCYHENYSSFSPVLLERKVIHPFVRTFHAFGRWAAEAPSFSSSGGAFVPLRKSRPSAKISAVCENPNHAPKSQPSAKISELGENLGF